MAQLRSQASCAKFGFSKFVAIRVICGRFEKTKQKVDQQSRSAELEARAESCPERCASQIENLRSCVGATHCADALGEIYFCDFPAPNLRNSHPNIFYRFCARDGNATPLGGRRILVLFTGRSAVGDCVLRSSAPYRNLCFRTRTYSRALSLDDGGTRQLRSR